MGKSRPIIVQQRSAHERRKRQREIWLAVAGTILIIFLSWIELQLLGLHSYLFFALFNVNLILLILVLFLVLRNVIKLILDRRRRVMGSALRTRLVLVFVTLSLIPTLIMFLLSAWFIRTSVDYWFQSQVESSMAEALRIGQGYYDAAETGLQLKADILLGHLREKSLSLDSKNSIPALVDKAKMYDLTFLGVLGKDGQETIWQSSDLWQEQWPEIRASLPLEDLLATPRYWATIWPHSSSDLVFGVVPVGSQGNSKYLILGTGVGKGFLSGLDQIAQGVTEYKQLRILKYPLKMTLYMVLGLMTMLIFLGATWFGFRLAREISAPVQALAVGTQRIARGDLSVRLKDDSSDELGLLVRSFNSMAQDLEQSSTRLTQANEQLEQQYQELIAQNHYVQAILNNITAGVVSLDRHGRISTMNKAAQDMLGQENGSFIGRSALEMFGPEHKELVKEIETLLQGNPGSGWQQRVTLDMGDEKTSFLINAVTLMDNEGGESGIVAVFENISELEKMQRLDAWKEVARRIAHEIKNPLTPIKLSAERLDRKFSSIISDPVFGQCTGIIIKQVEHLQKMVSEFSGFAKLPEVILKPEAVEPLLQEAITIFSGSHSSITWTLNIESASTVMLDKEAMRRALFNLLLNAGEVLEGKDHAQVDVKVYARKRNRRVYIEVSDNGPGINPEEQARMFEPYYSTKRGGTGLGLCIVKSIISDHHGHIRVKSRKPQGTTFIVELPAARNEV